MFSRKRASSICKNPDFCNGYYVAKNPLYFTGIKGIAKVIAKENNYAMNFAMEINDE